jgi:hypothetical protein
VSNIYLPFNKDSDLDNFKVFIQQLSNSDERIRRSCKEKNIGGYVNIESAIKEDESEEKEEEGEEKYSKVEYRYDMVYDSVEIKDKLSGEEKVKALIEYNKIPKQSEKYTYKEIHFNIGSFWDNIKQGQYKKLYNDSLSGIEIFREDYERIQNLKEEKKYKKELTSLEKIEALIEFYEKYNKIPKKEEKYTYKEIQFKIGAFWSSIKQGRCKKLYNDYLSKIHIFKEDYERIQNLKEKKKDKRELTPLEKIEALKEYNKIPKQSEKYTYKEIQFNIGSFWNFIQQGIHKHLYDKYLSRIHIFREDYERIQNLKEKKKDKRELTPLEKIEAIIEYNKIPKQSEKYTYKDIQFNIGKLWNFITQGGNEKLYNDYLSDIYIFKQDFNRVQKLKEEKKNKKELTPLEKIEALKEYNKIPKYSEKYTYKEIQFNIGSFWSSIKQGQYKKLYNDSLNEIEIFRENYERVQKLKEEKKDKRGLTPLEKIEGLIEFYEKYNKIPKKEEKHTYKDILFNIGEIWNNIKQGGNKNLYNKYLSNIPIFNKDYERVQKLKEEKKLKKN